MQTRGLGCGAPLTGVHTGGERCPCNATQICMCFARAQGLLTLRSTIRCTTFQCGHPRQRSSFLSNALEGPDLTCACVCRPVNSSSSSFDDDDPHASSPTSQQRGDGVADEPAGHPSGFMQVQCLFFISTFCILFLLPMLSNLYLPPPFLPFSVRVTLQASCRSRLFLLTSMLCLSVVILLLPSAPPSLSVCL